MIKVILVFILTWLSKYKNKILTKFLKIFYFWKMSGFPSKNVRELGSQVPDFLHVWHNFSKRIGPCPELTGPDLTCPELTCPDLTWPVLSPDLTFPGFTYPEMICHNLTCPNTPNISLLHCLDDMSELTDGNTGLAMISSYRVSTNTLATLFFAISRPPNHLG